MGSLISACEQIRNHRILAVSGLVPDRRADNGFAHRVLNWPLVDQRERCKPTQIGDLPGSLREHTGEEEVTIFDRYVTGITAAKSCASTCLPCRLRAIALSLAVESDIEQTHRKRPKTSVLVGARPGGRPPCPFRLLGVYEVGELVSLDGSELKVLVEEGRKLPVILPRVGSRLAHRSDSCRIRTTTDSSPKRYQRITT